MLPLSGPFVPSLFVWLQQRQSIDAANVQGAAAMRPRRHSRKEQSILPTPLRHSPLRRIASAAIVSGRLGLAQDGAFFLSLSDQQFKQATVRRIQRLACLVATQFTEALQGRTLGRPTAHNLDS
jgi:hypothetical protein